MKNWTEYTRFFTVLSVIVNPFMTIRILLNLTEGHSDAERHCATGIATLTVTAVLFNLALGWRLCPNGWGPA